MKRDFGWTLSSASLLALAMAGPAYAQDSDESADQETVVVTGTLIRGVEATGSQSITINAETIRQQAPQSTNDLLATLPQLSQFNDRFEEDPRGSERGITISRPDLRNLPGFNSASGSVTLVMMDGHRLAPVGINESSIDPDIIPTSVVERLELVTDGGSSIYGADAVAGVINFITRREFEGIQLDANYGIGDTISDYQQWDGTLTAGTSWEGGNAYIAAGSSQRDGIVNGETDWARLGIWQPDNTLEPIGTQCRVPVATERRWFWFGGGWTDNPAAPGAGIFTLGEPCDEFAESTLLPEVERYNAFGALTQDIADNIELHVTSYYMKRTVSFADYPLGYSAAPGFDGPPTTPGSFVGQVVAFTSGVGFSFGPHPAYTEREQEVRLETFGLTPELTIKLDNDWQVRSTLFYGRSNNSQVIPRVNNNLAQSYIDNMQLDPLDVASAADSVILDVLDWEEARQTNQEMFNFRTIVDGPVLTLPAGPLKAAVGVEFASNTATGRAITGQIGSIGGVDLREANRDLYSLFGEVAIPAASTLDISLSLRHDDYSDFGKTTNPNIGFDFHPMNWLSIYGHWGTSFNAPTVVDQFAISTAIVNANNSASVINGIDVFGEWDGSGDDVLQATGASATLDPQESEQWALGINASPINGLSLNLNYYEIDFTNILGATNPIDPRSIAANPDKYIWNPTQAQFDDFISTLNNQSELASLNADDFALLLDRVNDNINSAYLTGVDFSINYARHTNWGLFDVGLSGNHQITFELNGDDFLAFETPDLTLQGRLGWRGDNLSARLTVNYTDAFKTNDGQNGDDDVDSFTTANVFLGYDFSPDDDTGTQLRFVVDNVFDEEPPLWRRNAQNQAYSGFTLGRVFKVGITQNF